MCFYEQIIFWIIDHEWMGSAAWDSTALNPHASYTSNAHTHTEYALYKATRCVTHTHIIDSQKQQSIILHD